MKPREALDEEESAYVASLLRRVGEEVDGKPFRVKTAVGEEHIVVSSAGFVEGHSDVIDGLKRLLNGEGVFILPGQGDATTKSFSPDTPIRDLFRGESVRIPNILARSNIDTVGQFLELVSNEDALLGVRGFGPESLEVMKGKLGLGE